MTYGKLKDFTKGLLLGDKELPTDDKILLPQVDYALLETAKKADSIVLTTDNSFGFVIVRQLTSNRFIRRASLPTADSDEMDIDDELCFAIGNFIASRISKEKGGIFYNAWEKACKEYNKKVYSQLDTSKRSNMPDLV